MQYYFHQKYKINDFLNGAEDKKRVLISVPQAELSNLYASYFRAQEFAVSECADIGGVFKSTIDFDPHMLVLGMDTGIDPAQIVQLVQDAKVLFPHLPLIAVGSGMPQNILSQLMSTGVVGYIDRRFSRPHDLLTMAKTLLNY